jgi:hypothetical protein
VAELPPALATLRQDKAAAGGRKERQFLFGCDHGHPQCLSRAAKPERDISRYSKCA